MTAPAPAIAVWLGTVLGLVVLGLRLRRQFRPRPVQPVRFALRMGLLAALALWVALAEPGSSAHALEAAAAWLGGGALGLWAGAHARLERHEGTVRYQPHRYAGALLSALLIARVAYRMTVLPPGGAAAAPTDPLAALAASPLTVALLCAFAGYYLGFYGRVLWRARQLAAAAWSAPPGAGS